MPVRPRPAKLLALLIALAAGVSAWLVHTRVFEALPHIEDEYAYVWQAQVIAAGQLTIASPPDAKSFLVPFVVDLDGRRFGKYPPGWPAALAAGEFFGLRGLVNPLLGALAAWLTFRLGQRTLGDTVGLLAAGLTAISPFYLMNTGSLLSHPLGLVLTLGFTLGWLDAWQVAAPEAAHWRRPLGLVTAGLCLGTLALTRPLTAVGAAIPFGLHAAWLLLRPGRFTRRQVIAGLAAFGLIAAAVGGLVFVWQYAVTGDAQLNPYTLWWSYDKVGFGPGVGRVEGGHTLSQARVNTRHSLWGGYHDLFGWGQFSWIFLPFGLLAILRRRSAWLAASLFPALVLVYLAYWIGSWLFGPRYYYEGLPSLTIVSAAGIAWLAGWPLDPGAPWRTYAGWMKLRPLGMTALLGLLAALTLLVYNPIRLGGMTGLYGVTRLRLEPLQVFAAQHPEPALILVDADHWAEYAALLELSDPFLESPLIFVFYRGPATLPGLMEAFPDRQVYLYKPGAPYEFVRMLR